MPKYDYQCLASGHSIEVSHPMSITLSTWGELCQYADIDLGEIAAQTPVKRIITTPPLVCRSTSNAELKNHGFTKLEKREAGVYENVTRTGSEAKYMCAGDPSTLPHIHKRIPD